MEAHLALLGTENPVQIGEEDGAYIFELGHFIS
jgi:hypothetical protein